MHASRPLTGYGAKPPNLRWPNSANVALSIVVNYEEGSEQSLGAGDATQETSTEWGSYELPAGIRNLAMESMYEYGSRVGVWRLLRILRDHETPATFFACARALEIAPDVARAIVADGHEVCSHGYRWEEVFMLSGDEEREHIRLAVESIERTTGSKPKGWYCRYGPSEHTRRLLVEHGGFVYDSDAYNDDAPYFVNVDGQQHLVLPYTSDANDFRFWQSPGFVRGRDFAEYLIDTLDALRFEGRTASKMMSVGLHCRIIGRPGRSGALDSFLKYVATCSDVWVATRLEIAEWWLSQTALSEAEPEFSRSV